AVTQPSERREGDRRSIPTLRIDVVVPQRVGRLLRRTEERRHPGAIVEVSANGAQIEAPADLQLEVGARVQVFAGILRAVVRIVRRDVDADGTARYGVTWVELDPRLQARIDEVLGRSSSSPPGWPERR